MTFGSATGGSGHRKGNMTKEEVQAKIEATRLSNLFAKKAAKRKFTQAEKTTFERLKVKLKRPESGVPGRDKENH
jgi:hypothetical protein